MCHLCLATPTSCSCCVYKWQTADLGCAWWPASSFSACFSQPSPIHLKVFSLRYSHKPQAGGSHLNHTTSALPCHLHTSCWMSAQRRLTLAWPEPLPVLLRNGYHSCHGSFCQFSSAAIPWSCVPWKYIRLQGKAELVLA